VAGAREEEGDSTNAFTSLDDRYRRGVWRRSGTRKAAYLGAAFTI
jgi:hypothetical protein